MARKINRMLNFRIEKIEMYLDYQNRKQVLLYEKIEEIRLKLVNKTKRDV